MTACSKIVFIGTSKFAVPSLKVLAEKHEVLAVFSKSPWKFGRSSELQSSPVHACADELNIRVHHQTTLDENVVDDIRKYFPEFIVVVAYGLILPESVLSIPSKAAINGHASLLPRWRGAAPIHRAIEAGDEITGVTAMLMEETLDSGGILAIKKESIKLDDTTTSLHERLAPLTAETLVEAVDNFDSIAPIPQNEKDVTWAKKVSTVEAEIDFTQPAEVIERRIRAFTRTPGAWFSIEGKDGKSQRIKVLAAKVTSGKGAPGAFLDRGPGGGPLIMAADVAVELTSVQPQGKPVMDGAAFLNGYALPPVIGRRTRD